MSKAKNILKQLLAGNKRFVDFNNKSHALDVEKRAQLQKGQNPLAIVLTCSDSRVCPEIIFDCDLGELFVVRIASGSLNEYLLGGIEYAIAVLGIELIIVLGHDDCGVMNAILEEKSDISEDLNFLCKHVSRNFTEENKNNFTVEEGVKFVTRQDVQILKNTPLLKKKIEENKLKIIGAHYHFDTNEVSII